MHDSETILEKKGIDDLINTLLAMDSPAEMACFLRDIATIKELRDWCDRWQVAQMIALGMPYRVISSHTGLSTATITRVAHWLHYGSGGYLHAIAKKKSMDSAMNLH